MNIFATTYLRTIKVEDFNDLEKSRSTLLKNHQARERLHYGLTPGRSILDIYFGAEVENHMAQA